MKTNKDLKKLKLSKKTISNLNQKQMSSIHGGISGGSACRYTYCVSCYC